MYTELTSSVKLSSESLTDYVIRVGTAIGALGNAGETVTGIFLIAMVLKGLQDDCKPFVVVITQSEEKLTLCEFKAVLRSFEDRTSQSSYRK